MRGRKPHSDAGRKGDVPVCPEWLDDEAKVEWARVVPMLQKAQVIQGVDLAILAAYCSSWSLWVGVRRGLTAADVETADGKLNPRARFCESLLKQLRGLLDQLGFTPAARKQVLQGEPGADTLEEVLS